MFLIVIFGIFCYFLNLFANSHLNLNNCLQYIVSCLVIYIRLFRIARDVRQISIYNYKGYQIDSALYCAEMCRKRVQITPNVSGNDHTTSLKHFGSRQKIHDFCSKNRSKGAGRSPLHVH